MFSDSLFLIPARGGSKGVVGKNTKILNGKPLIYYSINAARELVPDDQICLTTDSDEIILSAEKIGLKVPFKRPLSLATDISNTYDVILHAYNYYKNLGKIFNNIILLQPTSPFRTAQHIKDAFSIYSSEIDMVVSVIQCKNNPYYNLFEESTSGFLFKKHFSEYKRRQDTIELFQYNGAIYIYNSKSLLSTTPDKFKYVKKYIMSSIDSVDIDTQEDWLWAEYLSNMTNK